jgi:hypothetical protein
MEILENRELLSANIYDDSATYNLYFNEQQYTTEQYENYSNSSNTSTTSDYSTSSSMLPIRGTMLSVLNDLKYSIEYLKRNGYIADY